MQEQTPDNTALTDRVHPVVNAWAELQRGDQVLVEGRGWAQDFTVEQTDDGKGRYRLRVFGKPGDGKRWNLLRVEYGSQVRVAGVLFGTVAGRTNTSLKVQPLGEAA